MLKVANNYYNLIRHTNFKCKHTHGHRHTQTHTHARFVQSIVSQTAFVVIILRCKPLGQEATFQTFLFKDLFIQ